MQSKPWTIAAVVIAVALFALAISHGVYELTSPSWFALHVLVRKIYSVVAFALVGYLWRRAAAENGRSLQAGNLIVGVALYSAGIEVGQFLHGSREGLGWNAFDILCGALGGALAVLVPARRTA
jgi:hypothetical protein